MKVRKGGAHAPGREEARASQQRRWRLWEIEEKLEAWLSRSGKRKLVGWGWIPRGDLVESGGGQEDGWDILPSF